MAKDTKAAATAAPASSEVTTENLLEVRKNQNLADMSLGEAIDEEIKKEKDERKKSQIKSRYVRAQYNVDRVLLQKRHSNRLNQIDSWAITQMGRAARLLKGFTLDETTLKQASKYEDDILKRETVDLKAQTVTIVTDVKAGTKATFKLGDKVPAAITYVEYDEFCKEYETAKRKKLNEEENIRTKERAEIDASYGEYWDSSWRCLNF